MLSFVTAIANVDTHGNLLERLQGCLDNTAIQVERAGLQSEMIIVEWNPPPDKQLLSEILRPVEMPVRIITVPREIHEGVWNPYGQVFFEWRAKNSGIRRARGEWILCHNADDLFSRKLIAAIANTELREDCFYRTDRHDVARKGAKPFLINRAMPWSFEGLHFNASGDFLMLHKSGWEKMRGYPEGSYDMSVDGEAVWAAHILGLKQVTFPDPVYHLDHPRRGRIVKFMPWDDAVPHARLNRDDSWGLARIEFAERGIQAEEYAAVS